VCRRRHGHHTRPDGHHLRAKVERVDGAKQRTAEGGPCGGEGAFVVDRQFGAVGGQPGAQRRCDRTGQIAAQHRGTEQEDFRLVGVDEIGHDLGVGFVTIMLDRHGCATTAP
jgi:hypothetical protein